MGKMSEMESTIKDLRDAAASINDIANYLTSLYMADDEPTAETPTQEPPLAFEAVRAILANKSREGFTAQIRELLQKHGGNKLSELDPACYREIVAEVEGLRHAT